MSHTGDHAATRGRCRRRCAAHLRRLRVPLGHRLRGAGERGSELAKDPAKEGYQELLEKALSKGGVALSRVESVHCWRGH